MQFLLTHTGCRSEERAQNACEQLKKETGNDRISVSIESFSLFLYQLIDMTDPKSIQHCVEQIDAKDLQIDVLINNAGVSMVHKYMEAQTGVEMTCQTNYIGVIQLTELLIPHLLSIIDWLKSFLANQVHLAASS